MAREQTESLVTLATVCMTAEYDKARNLERMLRYIEQAAERHADFVALPELILQNYVWDRDGDFSEAKAYQMGNAETVPGPATRRIAQAAAELKMWIVFGLTERGEDAKLHNTAVLVGPDGLKGSYRKVHLSAVEKLIWTAGNSWHVFDTPLGRIGMLICYDKAFPESARELVLQGTQILVAIGAWKMHGDDPTNDQFGRLWDVYDLARAAENQRWLISSNQVGYDGRSRRNAYGHSRIVDPTGSILGEVGYEEGIVTRKVNIAGEIERADAGLLYGYEHAILRHRQPETYKHITL